MVFSCRPSLTGESLLKIDPRGPKATIAEVHKQKGRRVAGLFAALSLGVTSLCVSSSRDRAGPGRAARRRMNETKKKNSPSRPSWRRLVPEAPRAGKSKASASVSGLANSETVDIPYKVEKFSSNQVTPPGFRVAPAARSGGRAAGARRRPGRGTRRSAAARSARLRGTRGRGMATPMARVPHDTSDESGGPRGVSGRGAVGAGAPRGEWEPGNLESWELAGLRRVAGFQICRFSSPPAPRPALAAVGRGPTPARWGDELSRGATKVPDRHGRRLRNVTSGCCRDLRVEEPGHFKATPQGVRRNFFLATGQG